MNEIPILVRCEPKAAKSSIGARIVRSWTKSVSESGVSAGFEMRDRLPNFRDSGSDFTRADGKEAENGFPARNPGEEEDADFQQKKTGRIRRNDWMTRRISNIGKELL